MRFFFVYPKIQSHYSR